MFILFPQEELSGLLRNVSSDQVLPALLPGCRTPEGVCDLGQIHVLL